MMKTVSLLVLFSVLTVFGSDHVLERDVNLNPAIPTETDDAFIQFQQAVANKESELKTPIVFSDLNSFKTAFDSFLTDPNIKLDPKTPVEVDSNFAKFQKFMTNNMRQYSNFNEFRLRYGLFLNVLSKMAGYNDGGDGLAGINHLADKTLEEKKGLYG